MVQDGQITGSLEERLGQLEDSFTKHKNLADATMDYLNNSLQENSKIASEEKKGFIDQLQQIQSKSLAKKGGKADKTDANVEQMLNQKIGELQKETVKADVFKKQMADVNKKFADV